MHPVHLQLPWTVAKHPILLLRWIEFALLMKSDISLLTKTLNPGDNENIWNKAGAILNYILKNIAEKYWQGITMGAQLFMLKKKRLQNKLVKNSGILNFGIFFLIRSLGRALKISLNSFVCNKL